MSQQGSGNHDGTRVEGLVTNPDLQTLADEVVGGELHVVLDCIKAVTTAYSEPVAGSPNGVDAAFVNDSNVPGLAEMMRGMRDDIGIVLRSCLAFVEAIKRLLTTGPVLPVPTLSLVRSLFDSVIGIARLLEPDTDPRLRLVRLANSRIDTAINTIDSVEGIAGPKESASYRKNLDELITWYEARGFSFKMNKEGRPTATSYAGISEARRWQVTETAQRLAPRRTYLWKTGSGATHNENWLTQKLDGTDEQVAAFVVGPYLDVCDIFIDAIGDYVGADVTEFHRMTHAHRLVIRPDLAERIPTSTYAGYVAWLEGVGH